jgi:hypothetical protein
MVGLNVHSHIRLHGVVLNSLSRGKGRTEMCWWPSPAQSLLVLGPVGTHDQIFVNSKNIYMFEHFTFHIFKYQALSYDVCNIAVHFC